MCIGWGIFKILNNKAKREGNTNTSHFDVDTTKCVDQMGPMYMYFLN